MNKRLSVMGPSLAPQLSTKFKQDAASNSVQTDVPAQSDAATQNTNSATNNAAPVSWFDQPGYFNMSQGENVLLGGAIVLTTGIIIFVATR